MASVATSSPSDDRSSYTRHVAADKSGMTNQRFDDMIQSLSRQLDGIKVTWRQGAGEFKICLWHAKSKNECRFAVKRTDPWTAIRSRILDGSSDLILTASDGRRRPAR
jgi:hypothetical protein